MVNKTHTQIENNCLSCCQQNWGKEKKNNQLPLSLYFVCSLSDNGPKQKSYHMAFILLLYFY